MNGFDFRKIRIVDDAQSVTGSQLQAEVSQDGNRYPFDQSAKHSLFWSYIREQQWQAVDALLDEKCILFYEKEDTLYRRRWRCSEFLRHSFGELKGLICPTPLVYSPGSTRSSIVLEESEFRSASELVLTKHDPFNRRLSLASSTVFEASLSLKLGGTSTKVPQLQRKDLLPVMDSSRATALPKLSLDSPVHNNVAPPSSAHLASHAVAVRISDVITLQQVSKTFYAFYLCKIGFINRRKERHY